MHPFPALVVGNCHGSQGQPVLRLNEAFNPVRDGVEGMKNVEEAGAGRKRKVRPERFDPPDGQEHTER